MWVGLTFLNYNDICYKIFQTQLVKLCVGVGIGIMICALLCIFHYECVKQYSGVKQCSKLSVRTQHNNQNKEIKTNLKNIFALKCLVGKKSNQKFFCETILYFYGMWYKMFQTKLVKRCPDLCNTVNFYTRSRVQCTYSLNTTKRKTKKNY